MSPLSGPEASFDLGSPVKFTVGSFQRNLLSDPFSVLIHRETVYPIELPDPDR